MLVFSKGNYYANIQAMSFIDILGKKLKIDANYVAKGSFWLVSGSALGSVLSLVTSIAAAHYIPKETFGIFKYIISMVGIAGAFALSGMNTVVTRSVSQGYEGSFIQSLKIQLRWSSLQFIFLFALSAYYMYMNNTMYGVAFIIASVFVPLSTISNTYAAFLGGKKNFKTSSLYSFFSNALYALIFSLAAIQFPYVLPLVIAYFISTAGANVFFCMRTIKKYKPNTLTQPDDEQYAIKLSLSNVAGIIAGHIDNIIVYHFLGPIQLAVYNFAMIIPDRIRTLSGFIPTIALPKLANHTDPNHTNARRYTYIVTTYALIIAVLYALFAPFFFSLFFPNYADSIFLSQIYSLSLIAIPSAFLIAVLSAYKMQRQLYFNNAIVPIIKIVLLAICIYFWGLMGAIVAKALGIFAQYVLLFGTLEK